VRSAIYEGTVTHHRLAPVDHHFEYGIALPLLFIDEFSDVCHLHPLWSARLPNMVWLRRADLLGDRRAPIDESVRDLVERHTGLRPGGPIAVLAQPRTLGWLFNPISISFCFTPDEAGIEALILEVSNTPWHEHHTYVLAGAGPHRFPKELHVSPFLGMDQEYLLRLSPPGPRLSVALANLEQGRPVLTTGLALERRPLSRAALGRFIWAYPLQTVAVSARIYRQALSLRRRSVPFHPHPRRSPGGVHG